MDIFNDENITKIAQILIAISSLMVSIVALRLSRKVSLKRNLKEKQFEFICEIIKDFSKEILLFTIKDSKGNTETKMIAFYQMRAKKFREQNPDFFNNKNLIFKNSSVERDFEFLKHTWNPLLPKSISVELHKFWGKRDRRITNEEFGQLDEYILLDFFHKEYVNYNYPGGNEFKDFESFYKFINQFMDKIDEWLDKHEAVDLKFIRY